MDRLGFSAEHVAWQKEYSETFTCWHVRLAPQIYEKLHDRADASAQYQLAFPHSFYLPTATEAALSPPPAILIEDASNGSGCGRVVVSRLSNGMPACSSCRHEHCSHVRSLSEEQRIELGLAVAAEEEVDMSIFEQADEELGKRTQQLYVSFPLSLPSPPPDTTALMYTYGGVRFTPGGVEKCDLSGAQLDEVVRACPECKGGVSISERKVSLVAYRSMLFLR